VAAADARAAIASSRLWYHTIEVAPGVVTPGWFDLRPVLDRLPWPDVHEKRCLDVGTYDGHLAFELERRGAAEVVATDLADHEQWDIPPRLRAKGSALLDEIAGEKGRGFEIARSLLGSSVERELINVYDLAPERIGTFDVVVCGSLLLHLRDPMRGLAAIRSVCRSQLMSCEQVRIATSALHPRKPVFVFEGTTDLTQWFVPNVAAHRAMLHAAGFEIQSDGPTYAVPFGPAHPPRSRGLGALLTATMRRIALGGTGVPHHALLGQRVS
jgi:tRNA (mo5U34)-methyltransferase